MSESIEKFYSGPSQDGGGAGLPVFTGSRRQIGGSFLSGLARFALPILKFLGGRLFNVAKNVASDVVIDKRPVRESLKKRGLDEVGNVLRGNGRKRRVMVGRGIMHRRGVRKTIRKKTKRKVKRTSKKRLAKRSNKKTKTCRKRKRSVSINKSRHKRFQDIFRKQK